MGVKSDRLLVTLTAQGGPPSQYRYNHLDRRIGRETNGQALRYRYVDLSLIETLNVTNTPVERFYYSGESLIGQKRAGEQRSYLLDALKSPQAQITAAGIVRKRMSFDAFGNTRSTTGTNDQPFGFTGYQLDPESNRYYALARYYDQSHGKFLSQDPELGDINNPPSLHRYLYAYANPGRYFDPDGRVAATVSGAALGFSLGVGQGVGSLLYDCAMWGDCQSPGALASLVAQNTIAGAQIGASIDVSVLSGGYAAPVVGGALAGAGLSGLTASGRAADWDEFASRQLAYAAGGAVAGAVIQSGGAGAGLASTAMGRIGGTAFSGALGGAAGDVTTQSIEIATGYREQLDQSRMLAAGVTGGVTGGATMGAMEYGAYRTARVDSPKVEPLLNLSVGNQSSVIAEGSGGPPLLLTYTPTSLNLAQLRRLNFPDRWQAGEIYVRELYGATGQQHFPVPTVKVQGESIVGTGGRFVDAPVVGNATLLAGEVKTYQRWRTISGKPAEQFVPMTDGIRQQILKDIWLRDNVPGYDPRWIFLDAAPAAELSEFLTANKIIHISHQ